MSDIKISIIIPCYNREDYIEECLLSVISQTYQNKEILLIDNESTDRSLEIVKKVQAEHPEIIIEECPNIYAHSWQDPVEKGISISTGEYFTIVGSDDRMEPTYVENVMKYIAVNPEKISFFQSPMQGIDENGVEVGEMLSHFYNDLKDFKKQLFLKQPVNTPTVIYKTNLFHEGVIKWESEEYLGAIDYDSFFRIAHHGHFIYPAQQWLGYYYRWNQSQLTWVMHQQEQNYDTKIQNHWRSLWENTDT